MSSVKGAFIEKGGLPVHFPERSGVSIHNFTGGFIADADWEM